MTDIQQTAHTFVCLGIALIGLMVAIAIARYLYIVFDDKE